MKNSSSQSQRNGKTFWRRSDSENILIRDRPDRGEEQGDFQGDSDGSSSTPFHDIGRTEISGITTIDLAAAHVERRPC